MDEVQPYTTVPRDEPKDTLACRCLLFMLAFIIFFADIWILDLAEWSCRLAGLPQISGWNWYGKATSIIFSCMLLALWPWLRRNVGLRPYQSSGSGRLARICFVAILALALAIGFLVPSRRYSGDTLLFQLLMPSIDEELLFRGILLAVLERAFGHSPMSNRLRLGYAGIITCLMFGVPHGLATIDGRYQFSFLLIGTTTAWAIPATLVRTRSGSLVWPVIYHGVWNATIFAVAMMR